MSRRQADRTAIGVVAAVRRRSGATSASGTEFTLTRAVRHPHQRRATGGVGPGPRRRKEGFAAWIEKAGAVAALVVAGLRLVAADFLLDQIRLREQASQTDGIWRAAFAVAAMAAVIATLQTADERAMTTGAVAADGLIAGASAGPGGTAERAVRALLLTGTGSEGGGRGRRSGGRRWGRQCRAGADRSGIRVFRKRYGAAQPEQGSQHRATRSAAGEHSRQGIKATIVHPRFPSAQSAFALDVGARI
ncbi:MAG: hypothetical protein AB7V46_02495 [Thermomicrobiales bacterium]